MFFNICLTCLAFFLWFIFQVFDRLHPVGLCMSYGHSWSLLDIFGRSFNLAVIDAIKDGKRNRLIGDNINWKTGVHDERRDRHEHMNHAFGSAVIIIRTSILPICATIPHNNCILSFHEYLLSPDEWEDVRWEYAVLISRDVREHIPSPAFIGGYLPRLIEGPHSEQLKTSKQGCTIANIVLQWTKIWSCGQINGLLRKVF